jgi:ankyrin repeat protein
VAGANPRAIFGGQYTSLAVCALYNEIAALRALLRSGRHDPAEKMGGARSSSWTAAHVCLRPPPMRDGDPCVPRLGALEVLVKEGGGAKLLSRRRDSNGRPLLFHAAHARCFHETALDALLRLHDGGGSEEEAAAAQAAVNARSDNSSGRETPIFAFLGAQGIPVAAVMPCVRKLVAAGAWPAGVFSLDGTTPLMAAVWSERLEAIRFLVQEVMVPVDERNPVTGETALHYFCCTSSHDTRIPALLLDAGADPNARTRRGCTALLAAVTAATWSAVIVQFLLERGASADIADNQGVTPLLEACSSDHLRKGGPKHVADLLAQASSVETRRAVLPGCGRSAVDLLVEGATSSSPSSSSYQWRYELVALLLSSGAPVLPKNLPAALEMVVKVGAARAAAHEAELKARVREYWRCGLANEDIVRLVMQLQELQEAQRRLEAAEARAAALEAELRELGFGTHSDEDDDDDEEEEDDDEEDDQSGGGRSSSDGPDEGDDQGT